MLEFIQNIDNTVIHFFDNLHTPVASYILGFFTFLGDNGYIWIAMALIMLFFKSTRKIGLTVGIALIFGLIVTNLFLKPTIARIRPYDLFGFVPLIDKPSDFSFPSGHATASFEGAIGCFLWNKKLGIIAIIVAILISFSRIYFQVHYISDVVAGAIIGSVLATFAYLIVKAVCKRKNAK